MTGLGLDGAHDAFNVIGDNGWSLDVFRRPSYVLGRYWGALAFVAVVGVFLFLALKGRK